MNKDYRNPVMRELRDQQVRFAPRDKQVEQANRAEKLLTEVQPDRNYSYEYLCFRITDYRPETTPHTVMTGCDVQHDLRRFVEDVSDAADIRPEEVNEPVLTVDQLSKQFNVSTKTISRWRDQGLVSRRFVFSGRKRVGFLRSSVDSFVTHFPERVARGERFSQLSDGEHDEIIERARRLARAGGCPSEVARRLARHFGRSTETIRYTLKNYDREHPSIAVFPDRGQPLTDDAKEQIYQQHRRGTPVEDLVQKHCRTKTSIYRIINEVRARRIMQIPLDYIPSPAFDRGDADRIILGPMPAGETSAKKVRVPAGLPPYLASLYETPLLTREQEFHQFRKFNYLKHCAARLRSRLDPARASVSVMERIENLVDQAVKLKNEIVQANLRLVVSIAKRHVSPNEDFFELVSDGNMSLIRAVEKFDFKMGNKFSTYASWAIMKNYARSIPDEFKHRDRYRTSHEEMFTATEDSRSDQYEQESAQNTRETQIMRILSRLDPRLQRIIIKRYGLDHRIEPQTLKEVGESEGVTKERVRQLESRALSELRALAAEENIDLPDPE